MNNWKKYWLLVLACAFIFGLSACSEDGGDGTTTTDTTSGGGGDGSCTENTNTCGLKGKDFNADNCTCVDKVGVVGDCAAVDELCDADLPQPDGFLCLELQEPDPSGKTGSCVQTCEGFFNDTCPLTASCMPKALFDVAKDICIPAGNIGEGQECSSLLDCQKGLFCVGGACVAPDCSPITTAQSCAEANEVCDGLTLTDGTRLDVGFCYQPCDGFVTPSTCDAGEWCSPGQTKTNGKFSGSCVTGGGSKAPGAACVSNAECQDGSWCFGDGQGGGQCGALCDATLTTNTGAGACPTGEGCSNLVIENDAGEQEELDIGTCIEACDFDNADACNDTADTCIPGEIRGASFDSCGRTLNLAPYAACTQEFNYCSSTSLCMELSGSGYDGMVCHELCRFAEGAAGSLDHKDCGGVEGGKVCATRFAETFPVGVCTTVDCDPTQTDSGACDAATEACRLITNDNPNAGQCSASCNYDDPTSTCADGKQCYSGEILGFFQGIDGLTGDFCDDLKPPAATKWPLNPGETCDSTNKLEEFQLCGPLALCIEIEDAAAGVRCYEFCRASEKALGSTAHPDCNSPTQTCTGLFNGVTELGVCLGQ